jgi:two-component system chemotaxis response regulator CheY
MSCLSHYRVLVIDDIQIIRDILAKDLNELGITDIQASDSLEDSWNILLHDLEEGRPIDLIFCDWNMPKGDGINLLEKLRSGENKQLRLTKFIMVTGADAKVLEAMDKGANNIIHKPFSIQILIDKLELLFGEFEN